MPPRIRPDGPPLRPEPQRDVPTELRPLATYAGQRALLHRPLELESLRALRRADDTVRETRALLRVGRGNVDVDIRRSNHESTHRMSVARQVAADIANLPPRAAGADARDAINAAIAVVAGAGNCAEMAHVAMRLHAGRMEPGQGLQVVANLRDDHAWLEQVPGSGEPAGTVVIDPWMRGPAVQWPDANEIYARERRPVAQVAPGQGQHLRGEFGALVETAAGCSPEIEAGVQHLAGAGYRLQASQVRQEEEVTSAAFRAAAREAAARAPRTDLGAQVAIVAAARELGASVRGAAAFAAGLPGDLA